MKKIILISREFPPDSTSGIANYGLEIYKNLKKRYNVVVYTQIFRKLGKDEVVEESNSQHNINDSGIKAIFKMLLRIQKEKNTDIIVANGFGSSIVGTLAKLLIKKPLICVVQDLSAADSYNNEIVGLKRFMVNSIYKVILKVSDRIIATSPKVLNDIKKNFTIDYNKVIVSPIGINLSIRKKAERYISNKNNKIFTILFVGPLYRKRGLEYLVRALDLLKKDDIDFKCFVCGPRIGSESKVKHYEKYYEFLESLIKEYNLTQKIEFLGRISEKQLINLYKKCDILVNPTFHSDGFGMPNIEASLFETPSIATTFYEETGVIINGKTGLLFPHKDYHKLYLAIKKLALDKKLRRQLGKNSRKHAMKFTWEPHIDTFLNIIDDLCTN